MTELVNWFLNGDSAWALLFTFLFVYVLKVFREREKDKEKEIERLSNLLHTELKNVQTEIQVVTKVWKTLIKEELKNRSFDDQYDRKG